MRLPLVHDSEKEGVPHVMAWCFTRTDVVEDGFQIADDNGQTWGITRVRRRSITVAAASWYDAREHAAAVLGMDAAPDAPRGGPPPPPPSLSWRQVEESEATVRVEWEGRDTGLPLRQKVARPVVKINGKANGSHR